MQLLPFKVSPKAVDTVDVGNTEIGVLSFPKLKDLSPLERRFIKAQGLFDFQKELATLAKRISKAAAAKFVYVNDRIYGYIFDIGVIAGDTVTITSEDKDHKALKGQSATILSVEKTEAGKVAKLKLEGDKEITISTDALEIVDPEWFGEFYSEVIAFQNEFLASLETQKLTEVTAVIRYRLNPEPGTVPVVDEILNQVRSFLKAASIPETESLIKSLELKFAGEQGVWGLQHTSNPDMIRSELVDAISEFIVKEKAHWVEVEPVEPKESTEEELGKS